MTRRSFNAFCVSVERQDSACDFFFTELSLERCQRSNLLYMCAERVHLTCTDEICEIWWIWLDWLIYWRKKIKSPKETRRSQKPPRVRDEAEFRLLRTRGQKNAQQLVWDETNWSQWTLMFWTGIYFMSSRQTESEIPALWTSLHHKEWDDILNHTEKWHWGSSSVIYCDVS